MVKPTITLTPFEALVDLSELNQFVPKQWKHEIANLIRKDRFRKQICKVKSSATFTHLYISHAGHFFVPAVRQKNQIPKRSSHVAVDSVQVYQHEV